MTTNPSFRRLWPWAAAILLALAAAYAAVKAAGVALESNYKSVLDTEVRRRGLELNSVTISSNVMGSVAALGLINQTAKGVARGVTPLDHPAIMETLEAIGQAYQANGVYLVGSNGIVQSCWYTIGVTLTGVDVNFRPYFQIAMKGKQNVYAAIGTTTGQRSLYFAAPLYDEATARAPIIGVAVARLDVERIDSLLKAWTSGPALLLSPQGVIYASNRIDLNEHSSAAMTPDQMKTIRELKQFGKVFDSGTPKTLPFDIGRETVSFENHRYAVVRAPVQWNDPSGEWTLVLLGDLDALMPTSRRAAIGVTTGVLAMVLSALFLVWRRRLQNANAQRERAQIELKAYTEKLELDSETKTFLGMISTELHRAASLADFARTFMQHAAPQLAADYGAFYVLDEASHLLTPVGGHGVLTHDLAAVAIGQGLVGQCAKDMTAIAISDAAESDIRIVWGEGAVAPKSIILLPVAQAGRLLGVIVLAALREIGAERRALLDAMMRIVAINLEVLERNLGTQRQAELLERQQVHLQETEAWYRGVIESAPDGMLIVDEQGVIVLTNPQIDVIFGYDAGTLVGQKIEVLVPPEVRSRHPALREGFVQSESARAMGAINRQLRGVRRDGNEFPVEIGLSRLPALGGRGACVCTSVRDITERKRIEDSIRLANEEQTAIFESATLGIAFVRDRVIVRGNGKLNELFGLTGEEQIGQSTRIWYPDDDAYAAGGGDVYEALKRGETHQREQRLQRKDGTQFWCQLSGRAVDASDLARGTVWMLEDVTERRQSDQAIAEERARLRGLLEGSPAAVAIVTEDGEQIFSNRRLADMLGVPPEAMKLRRTTEFWADPGDRVAFVEKFKREGRLDDYEARFRRDDDKIIWVLLNTRWIEQDGQRTLISWLYDITERKQAENELGERMQELERFGRLTVDREEKMIQLKEEINGLLEQLGKERKYKIVV